MIPRIQTGTSFKGAGLYYLHDKRAEGEKERDTKDRVAWTYAINTLENDPDAVLAEMRHTAFDQPLLKMESGNRVDGRPTAKPVMTVSLAWAPDEKPTQKEMIEAGHSFLRHMGWEGHQVLFVSHNDTKHPHVHLIINRIHPETGMTQDAAWTKHRSQQWALQYERERGHVYCEAREGKYGRDGERAPSGMTQREWKLWQEISKENALDPEYRRVLEKGEWAVLKDSQRDARIAFWKDTGQQRKELRSAVREEVRREFAGEWTRYAKTKAERDQAATLYNREARHAMRELRRAGNTRRMVTEIVKGPDGRTYRKRRGVESPAIEKIKERQKAYNERHREELWKLREQIIVKQQARFALLAAPALDQLSKDRMTTYNELLAAQRSGKAELRESQSQQERKRDVLQNYKSPSRERTGLTKEQTEAYKAHARSVAAPDQQFDGAKREVEAVDHGRSKARGREPPKQQPVRTKDQNQQQKDKETTREAKNRHDLEWLLQKRAIDRARDRGGGRDR